MKYRRMFAGLSVSSSSRNLAMCVQQRKAEFLRYNGVGLALAGIEYLAEAIFSVLSVACISDKMHTGPISKGRSVLDSVVEIKPSTL